MYPRNAASPEPIAIGAVVQISDGAVQSSGVTVRIKPIGVAEADGVGTTAYSTDGIVEYTPTQAETNYTSFILIAKKAGCIPVAVTIVTSAASVAGQAALETATQASIDAIEVDTNSLNDTKIPQTLNLTASGNIGIDWANVENPTTAVDLSATDIQLCDTVTAVTNQVTANATAISGSTAAADNVEIIYDTHYANNYDATNRRWYVDSVAISGSMTAANNAQAAFDGTGYAFTNCTIPNVAGSVGSVLGAVDSVNGNVGGNVVGSVGSVLGGINTTAGTITTLDALDTAQDTQHTTTQGKVDTAQLDLDAITAADGVVVGPTAVASIFSTTAVAESYAADGAAGTPAQLLYLIQQAVTEFAFLTTTKTVKQLDGSSTAATFTLDDAANPTSSTRAT